MSWIGVVDSGVGGLSVWRELRRVLPRESLLYYADTASCPYGGRGREQIIELTLRSVEELLRSDVKLVVVACNTMTAAAISTLRSTYPDIPFVGMEPAVKPAAGRSLTGVVAILATEATLRGDLYLNTKSQYAQNVEIIELAGVGLVEMVERDMVDSVECENLLRSYIDPMIERGADTLVLGCTHFPFLVPVIKRLYADRLMLENPASAVARRVESILVDRGELEMTDREALCRFVTSGTRQDLENLERFAARL